MALQNSLFTGVSGLRNHQAMLDVIGNNISNVNTIGFKGSRATFSDTFNQFVRYGANPTEATGGTNAFQIGLGVKINSIDRNWTQGTFETTGILTDLALQGKGMFILKNNGETFYSRAGAFTFDADGKLVNPQNGAIVQGKIGVDGVIPPGNNLEDIKIDPNLKLPAVASTNINWGGNLTSNSSLTRSEELVHTGNMTTGLAVGDELTYTNTIYDHNGNEYTFNATYEKTADNTYDLTYELTDSDGNPVGAAVTTEVVFDADTGEVLTIGGNPPAAINIADPALGIDFDFDLTTVTQKDGTTTVSSSVDNNRESNVVTGTVTIFDSLGVSHTLSLKFSKTAANEWNWNVAIPESSGTLNNGSGTISFNPDGSIKSISPNPPVLSFTPSNGSSAQSIELNLGEGFSGVTQTSASSVISALSQNGSAAANLSNLSIDQYGYIIGVFSNGQSRNLAQVMVATFPNLNGLVGVGGNMYSVSANSGEAFIGFPGETTQTTIQSRTLEQSNVDLTEEFTRMIVSQRGFQANARVITVSDSLLQETTNLVR